MKDQELREMFASLERKMTATGAGITGGDPKDWFDRLERIERKIDDAVSGERPIPVAISEPKQNVIEKWTREISEQSISAIEKLLREAIYKEPPPRPLELPSPRIPLIVGMGIGALLFTAGMFAGTFLK